MSIIVNAFGEVHVEENHGKDQAPKEKTSKSVMLIKVFVCRLTYAERADDQESMVMSKYRKMRYDVHWELMIDSSSRPTEQSQILN